MFRSQKVLVLLSALVLAAGSSSLTLAASSNGLTAQDCAKLNDRAARLACFDQVFSPPESEPQTVPDPVVPSVPVASEAPPVEPVEPVEAPQAPVSIETVPLEPAQSAAPSETVEPTNVEEPAAAAESEANVSEAPKRSRFGSALNRQPQEKISSRIKAVRSRDRQRMVFLLENGDVWMQTSPRNLPIKEGDEVTIKSGLLGGYILRTENKVSSRVHRIDPEDE